MPQKKTEEESAFESSESEPANMLEPNRRVVDGSSCGKDSTLTSDDMIRFRRGDQGAMALFFDCYFKKLYNLSYRLTGNAASAQDLVQDTFLRIQSRVSTFEEGRDPWPWLIAIAYNVFRDRKRKRSSRIDEAIHTLDDSTAAPDDGPVETALASERESQVQKALLALSPQKRAIVWFHAYEGLSHSEISKLAGMSHDAVRKNYSRALQELGAYLREVGV